MGWVNEERATTYPCARHLSVGAVAGVAVLLPMGAVRGHMTVDAAVAARR